MKLWEFGTTKLRDMSRKKKKDKGIERKSQASMKALLIKVELAWRGVANSTPCTKHF